MPKEISIKERDALAKELLEIIVARGLSRPEAYHVATRLVNLTFDLSGPGIK